MAVADSPFPSRNRAKAALARRDPELRIAKSTPASDILQRDANAVLVIDAKPPENDRASSFHPNKLYAICRHQPERFPVCTALSGVMRGHSRPKRSVSLGHDSRIHTMVRHASSLRGTPPLHRFMDAPTMTTDDSVRGKKR